MTRQQKLVLIVLAILDFAVIGAMGAYVVITSQRTASPVAAVESDPCADAVLAQLGPWAATTLVDWSPDTAFVEMTHPDPDTASAPADLVWDLFDHLPADLASVCAAPQTVTLTVHAGTPREQTQTAVVNGTVLYDWLAGAVSDDDLAAQTKYRIAP